MQWQAYYEIDPFGGYRSDLGFALLAYLQAGDKDKSIHDFVLIDPNPMTEQEHHQYTQTQNQIQAQDDIQKMLGLFGRYMD